MQMTANKLYLVPGPVQVPEAVAKIYLNHYGSPDLDPVFLATYQNACENLQKILATKNDIVIMSGEGMLALWAGLKSTLKPGDKVLAIANGFFGQGIGEMAQSLGAKVQFVEYSWQQQIADFQPIEDAIKTFQPKLITAVHCETPTGIINPLTQIGQLKTYYQVPLFYVDAVSSIGGIAVNVDNCAIDLCLGAGQKVLSTPADTAFLSISDAAWQIIDELNYQGYDALKPFKNAVQQHYFPYTPHWHGIAALAKSCELLLTEGLENVFMRHQQVAEYWRNGLLKLGYELYPDSIDACAVTVTAVWVPQNLSWHAFNKQLLDEGLVVGGNYGNLAEKVFRIGHMGVQAQMELATQGLVSLGSCTK